MAAQEHLACFGQSNNHVVEAVEVATGAGASVERVTLGSIHRGLQRVAAAVELSPRRIHVEGDVAPQPVPEGIPVEAHVGPHVVVLGAPPGAGQVVDDLGHIEQVEHRVASRRQRGRLPDAVGQLKIVGAARVVVGLEFLEDAGAGEVRGQVAHGLVEGAPWVVAHALHLFLADDIVVEGQLIELTIEMDSDGIVERGGDSDCIQEPEAEALPQVGWVEVFGQERRLADTPAGSGMTEFVPSVELQAMRLLVESRRGVSAQFHVGVVVEFAVVEEGDPTTGLGVDAGQLIGCNEEVEDRQLSDKIGGLDDCAEVFRGGGRAGEERPAGGGAEGVCGHDPVADHLPWRGQVGGQGGRVDAISGRTVSVGTVIPHRDPGLRAEEDAVAQRDTRHRLEGVADPGCDAEVFGVRGDLGCVQDLPNEGPRQGGAPQVGRTGCGSREVDARRSPIPGIGLRYLDNSMREVGHLRWIGRFELAGDIRAVRTYQCQVFAARGELEIGVQAGSWSPSVGP